jgi:hypothetical protein
VAGFIDTLGVETKAILDKSGETLDLIATRLERSAASALRGPSAERYLAISAQAAALAERAFPDSDVASSAPAEGVAIIARKFDDWLSLSASGGIEVVGAALPHYLVAMRRYFDQRQEAGTESTVRLPDDLPKDFPTSPHIMAFKPTLARTLVPRVTIRTGGRALDDALVDEVAKAFLSSVQRAHQGGLKVLADLQAASGA